MTVENSNRKKIGDENDKFPVGMRVLAVDDDMTCLKLLERLLQKCQYQVTTTNEAKVALEMLRENRNRFDIIITDVHMPDMDGLKLLELVGLEMDLPVIMLSVNSDPKLVMKGITHGACDYLVKPVRLEELKNIWQHVIRKKKREPRQQNMTDPQDKNQQISGEIGNRPCSNVSSDQNGKRSNRKRKDNDKQEEEQEEDDEEGDYNGTDSDEPNTQKKPRIVWSIDLHKKFVQAVNQLGIGKGAVPKRILEHMNVEGLTRENVASHLQKYRLYLKRINSVVTQANIKDPYMRINSFDRVADLSTLATNQGRFSNSAMSSYQTGATLNRLNTPSGGNLFSTSSLIHTNNRTQNISNSFSTLNKFDPLALHTNNSTSYPGNINLIASSINNLPSAQKNILSSAQNGGRFSNQSSEPFYANTCSTNLNNGVFTNLLSGQSFSRNPLVPSGIIENTSPGGHILNNPIDFSSTNVISTSAHDSRGDGLFGHFRNTNNVVTSPFSHSFDQNNRFSQRKTEMPSLIVQNSGLPTFLHQNGREKLAVEPKSKPNGDFFLEQWRSQGGFGPTGFDALDEFQMNLMTKVDQEGNMVMDGEFGVDEYIE